MKKTIDDQHFAVLPPLLRLLVLKNAVDALRNAVVSQSKTGKRVKRCATDVARGDSGRSGDKNVIRAVLLPQPRHDETQQVALSRSGISGEEQTLFVTERARQNISLHRCIVHFLLILRQSRNSTVLLQLAR